MKVDTEVVARGLGLEAEHRLKLLLLQTELKEEMDVLKLENRNLHEKLQHEVCLKEDLERVSVGLAPSVAADSEAHAGPGAPATLLLRPCSRLRTGLHLGPSASDSFLLRG